MKVFFSKPYRWAIVLSMILTVFSVYVLLDTFVIPKDVTQIQTEGSTGGKNSSAGDQTANQSSNQSSGQTPDEASGQSDPIITDSTYHDDNITITIDTVREYDTTFYVADIQVTDPEYLKTALAENTFGRNIKETTSEMAADHNAILAINGDYYGFRNTGYVLRNGVLYRETTDGSTDNEDLVIDDDGDFSIVNENEVSAQSLSEGVWQIFSFGPALIEDGNIAVTASSEVSQSKSSNPRTAIGQVSGLHYIIIVSDGRTSESEGLSLLEMAQEFAERDCTVAYNLDGGGSSTMVFNGEVVNNPTNGRSMQEREVSDIVYIGY
ncbi:phosphodiester glycosidase family protein [Dehalobacter sp. DCM]|uniref:phosphodiester glycosidase family protein n=1 Tax=Dehalobacter sp. DCM TaxID=2907827 RepID=UPI003081300B|nr:phosphodiester glycosidase family protein [Dehalobacter sp. DCM]